MDGREELARRLQAWLDEKRWSPRRLSLAADCAENQVGRILERPSRDTEPDTWRKLAHYLKWDEAEVLALAGYGSLPDTPADPWVVFETALRLLHLSELHREHLRRQAQALVRLTWFESNAAPPPASPDPGPRPSRRRTSGTSVEN